MAFHGRKTPRERGLNQVFAWYKYSAKKRGQAWLISKPLFERLTSLPCSYCGLPPTLRKFGYAYNGLDRKDNRRGYSPTNVVTCCSVCNSVKGQHLTHVEMLAGMGAIQMLRRCLGLK